MYRTQCVLAMVALFLGLAHSWDIAVTAEDRIEFYSNGTKTVTVHFNYHNLTAIAYDDVHNILLYVDKQNDNDAICGYNILTMKYKCYIERNGRNIQGLAFDPITQMLFFTDTKERSINWISFKPGSENNVYGNHLITMAEWVPTDIVVDSCRGYIYWINTNLTTSKIERARFNGFEREVVINASSNWKLHSLAIDQQTQKIYWFIHRSLNIYHYLLCADLNVKNTKHHVTTYSFLKSDETFKIHPNTLTISKDFLFVVDWCSSCRQRRVRIYLKPLRNDYNIFDIHTESVIVGIAANYKISEQIQGVQDCKALTSLTNKSINEDSFKIAREYVEPFYDHGIKVDGQSLCKCTPGYTGKRCDVSVCENYCLQGNCSFNEEGLPKCRCNAGYSGERCEVNVCHGYCLNNGICTSNEENKPICQCINYYTSDRCEVSDCLNYCLQGDCSFSEERVPECRCNAGFNGERCEVNVCHGYCSNNGTCSLNEENEPVCQCIDDYTGDRCDVPVCVNNGDCSLNEEGSRCKAVKNNTLSTTSTYYTAEKNITLADLLANWRKPVAAISVVVEVKPN